MMWMLARMLFLVGGTGSTSGIDAPPTRACTFEAPAHVALRGPTGFVVATSGGSKTRASISLRDGVPYASVNVDDAGWHIAGYSDLQVDGLVIVREKRTWLHEKTVAIVRGAAPRILDARAGKLLVTLPAGVFPADEFSFAVPPTRWLTCKQLALADGAPPQAAPEISDARAIVVPAANLLASPDGPLVVRLTARGQAVPVSVLDSKDAYLHVRIDDDRGAFISGFILAESLGPDFYRSVEGGLGSKVDRGKTCKSSEVAPLFAMRDGVSVSIGTLDAETWFSVVPGPAPPGIPAGALHITSDVVGVSPAPEVEWFINRPANLGCL